MKRWVPILIRIALLLCGISQAAGQLQWRINDDGTFDVVSPANECTAGSH